MKKITMIMIIVALTVVGVTQILSFASVSLAQDDVWDSCSRGMVGCEYPGICGSYIDTNNDGICDRSQLPPQQDALPENPEKVEDSVVYNPAGSISSDSEQGGYISGTPSYIIANAGEGRHRSLYNLLPIILVTTILYMASWILSKKKVISQKLHRRIWNILLMISTIVSALLGFILILNLEYSTGISLPLNMLFWHVEAGIVVGLIALFHILWHWRYFVKIHKMGA